MEARTAKPSIHTRPSVILVWSGTKNIIFFWKEKGSFPYFIKLLQFIRELYKNVMKNPNGVDDDDDGIAALIFLKEKLWLWLRLSSWSGRMGRVCIFFYACVRNCVAMSQATRQYFYYGDLIKGDILKWLSQFFLIIVTLRPAVQYFSPKKSSTFHSISIHFTSAKVTEALRE